MKTVMFNTLPPTKNIIPETLRTRYQCSPDLFVWNKFDGFRWNIIELDEDTTADKIIGYVEWAPYGETFTVKSRSGKVLNTIDINQALMFLTMSRPPRKSKNTQPITQSSLF